MYMYPGSMKPRGQYIKVLQCVCDGAGCNYRSLCACWWAVKEGPAKVYTCKVGYTDIIYKFALCYRNTVMVKTGTSNVFELLVPQASNLKR